MVEESFFDMVEVHSIKDPHVFEHYAHGDWFVVIRKAVIFSTEYPEETFIYELRAEWVKSWVETFLKGKLLGKEEH